MSDKPERYGSRAAQARERNRQEGARKSREQMAPMQETVSPAKQETDAVLKRVDAVSDDSETQKLFEESVADAWKAYATEDDPDVSSVAATDLLLSLNEAEARVREEREQALASGKTSEGAVFGVERGRLRSMLEMVTKKDQLFPPGFSLNTAPATLHRTTTRIDRMRDGKGSSTDMFLSQVGSSINTLASRFAERVNDDQERLLQQMERVSGFLTTESGKLYREAMADDIAGEELTGVVRAVRLAQVEVIKLRQLQQELGERVNTAKHVEAVESATERASAQATRTPERTQTTPEAREANNEILNELFKEGGVAVNVSLPTDYSQEHSHGFQFVQSRRLQEPGRMQHLMPGTRDPRALKREMSAQGIHEFVGITPRRKPDQFTEKKTGFMGIKKERVRVEGEPYKHVEMVPGGRDEPLYELVYSTINIPNADGDYAYRDYSGRAGQRLSITIALPESLARKTMEAMKQNPELVRQMVDRARKETLKVPDEDWNKGTLHNNGHPLKPPYETWRKQDGKAQIYFEEPEDRGKEFDPKNAVTL